MTARPITAHARAAMSEFGQRLPGCRLTYAVGRKHHAIEVEGFGRRERFHLSSGNRDPYLERGWARQWAARFMAMGGER